MPFREENVPAYFVHSFGITVSGKYGYWVSGKQIPTVNGKRYVKIKLTVTVRKVLKTVTLNILGYLKLIEI